MVHKKDDIEFQKLTGLGTTAEIASQEDPDRKILSFQNTGTTTLTIGKSKKGSKELTSVGEGWILAPASATDKGDGGTVELRTHAKLHVVSDAAGGQMVRTSES